MLIILVLNKELASKKFNLRTSLMQSGQSPSYNILIVQLLLSRDESLTPLSSSLTPTGASCVTLLNALRETAALKKGLSCQHLLLKSKYKNVFNLIHRKSSVEAERDILSSRNEIKGQFYNILCNGIQIIGWKSAIEFHQKFPRWSNK